MTSPAVARDLPAIVEIKRTLDGREKRFDCRLLALAPDHRHAAVLWIAPEPMHVHGIDLPAGTVSVGHFWTDRNYNVYHWLGRAGETLGYYFNICDETRITAGTIEWRDLVVDVLAIPAVSAVSDWRLDVLDEHELPDELPPGILAHIAAGKDAILGVPAAVIAEVEEASRAVLPRVG
jgi:predicted RNA-binding protein associated with RNAse of E/G family